MSVPTLFTVAVIWPDGVSHHGEATGIVAAHLSGARLVATTDDRHRAGLVVTLEASDLWLALLSVMNAMTAAAAAPTVVSARPASEAEVEGLREA